jgi:hypothetical protein
VIASLYYPPKVYAKIKVPEIMAKNIIKVEFIITA